MTTNTRSTSKAILCPVLAFLVAVCGCQRQDWETLVDTSTTTTRNEPAETLDQGVVAELSDDTTDDSQADAANTLTGKVVRVVDGDTIEVLVNETPVRVRLEGIDTPETGQPFGDKAERALCDLVFGKPVRVQSIGEDRYGRTLGRVSVGAVDVNHHLVIHGWAWWYEKYSDDETLAEAEKAAREAKWGLWSDAQPIAPWDWRKGER